jgi:hypothetical protein
MTSVTWSQQPGGENGVTTQISTWMLFIIMKAKYNSVESITSTNHTITSFLSINQALGSILLRALFKLFQIVILIHRKLTLNQIHKSITNKSSVNLRIKPKIQPICINCK